MDNGWFYQQMAANSAPSSNAVQPPSQPKKARRWIIFIAVGIILLIFVPLIIIAAVESGKTSSSGQVAENPDNPENPDQPDKDTPLASIEADIHSYLSSIASDPNYEPSFEKDETEYSRPPANFSCDRIVEVPYIDKNIMDLELDYGFVIIISGKGSAPFTSTGNSVLVYSGSLKNSTYKTVSINCPSSSPIASDYTTYNGSTIFDNLSSDKHFYVWIDEKYLSSKDE